MLIFTKLIDLAADKVGTVAARSNARTHDSHAAYFTLHTKDSETVTYLQCHWAASAVTSQAMCA